MAFLPAASGVVDDDKVFRLMPKGLIGVLLGKNLTPEEFCNRLAMQAGHETTEDSPIPAMVWIGGKWSFGAVSCPPTPREAGATA